MALDPEALEIISALLDRVEALECKIAERDALLERLRTMHLPRHRDPEPHVQSLQRKWPR